MGDGRRLALRRAILALLLPAALLLAPPARGQEATTEAATAEELSELRVLIEDMQRAHSEQVESLQRRIDELEAVQGVQTELGGERLTEQLGRPGLPRSERERFTTTFDALDVTRGFTFGGYFRSGYGIDEDGDILEAFQAPNADSKYRLGNEEETYVETVFAYSFPNLDLEEGQEFYIQFRPSYLVPDANFNDSSFSIREMWAGARGVWKANPTAAFWAGQRFYDRFDVHMTDFYYLDMSGFGGGVEDIQIGEYGKLAIAWFGGTIDEFVSNGTQEANTTNTKNSLDIRFADFEVPYGKGLLWLSLAYAKDSEFPNGTNAVFTGGGGFALGFIHEAELWGGRNRAVFQYGYGPAANFRSSQEDFSDVAPEDGPPLEINANDIWHVRFVDDLVIHPSERWSIGATFVYDLLDAGFDGDSRREWISIGVRPIYHFNNFFSIQFEAGFDHTDADGGDSGELLKLTLAPQITPGRGFFSRPSIRTFVTYAHWSGSFEGQIAPRTYGTDTNGFTAGIQAEAWW